MKAKSKKEGMIRLIQKRLDETDIYAGREFAHHMYQMWKDAGVVIHFRNDYQCFIFNKDTNLKTALESIDHAKATKGQIQRHPR